MEPGLEHFIMLMDSFGVLSGQENPQETLQGRTMNVYDLLITLRFV